MLNHFVFSVIRGGGATDGKVTKGAMASDVIPEARLHLLFVGFAAGAVCFAQVASLMLGSSVKGLIGLLGIAGCFVIFATRRFLVQLKDHLASSVLRNNERAASQTMPVTILIEFFATSSVTIVLIVAFSTLLRVGALDKQTLADVSVWTLLWPLVGAHLFFTCIITPILRGCASLWGYAACAPHGASSVTSGIAFVTISTGCFVAETTMLFNVTHSSVFDVDFLVALLSVLSSVCVCELGFHALLLSVMQLTISSDVTIDVRGVRGVLGALREIGSSAMISAIAKGMELDTAEGTRFLDTIIMGLDHVAHTVNNVQRRAALAALANRQRQLIESERFRFLQNVLQPAVSDESPRTWFEQSVVAAIIVSKIMMPTVALAAWGGAANAAVAWVAVLAHLYFDGGPIPEHRVVADGGDVERVALLPTHTDEAPPIVRRTLSQPTVLPSVIRGPSSACSSQLCLGIELTGMSMMQGHDSSLIPVRPLGTILLAYVASASRSGGGDDWAPPEIERLRILSLEAIRAISLSMMSMVRFEFAALRHGFMSMKLGSSDVWCKLFDECISVCMKSLRTVAFTGHANGERRNLPTCQCARGVVDVVERLLIIFSSAFKHEDDSEFLHRAVYMQPLFRRCVAALPDMLEYIEWQEGRCGANPLLPIKLGLHSTAVEADGAPRLSVMVPNETTPEEAVALRLRLSVVGLAGGVLRVVNNVAHAAPTVDRDRAHDPEVWITAMCAELLSTLTLTKSTAFSRWTTIAGIFRTRFNRMQFAPDAVGPIAQLLDELLRFALPSPSLPTDPDLICAFYAQSRDIDVAMREEVIFLPELVLVMSEADRAKAVASLPYELVSPSGPVVLQLILDFARLVAAPLAPDGIHAVSQLMRRALKHQQFWLQLKKGNSDAFPFMIAAVGRHVSRIHSVMDRSRNESFRVLNDLREKNKRDAAGTVIAGTRALPHIYAETLGTLMSCVKILLLRAVKQGCVQELLRELSYSPTLIAEVFSSSESADSKPLDATESVSRLPPYVTWELSWLNGPIDGENSKLTRTARQRASAKCAVVASLIIENASRPASVRVLNDTASLGTEDDCSICFSALLLVPATTRATSQRNPVVEIAPCGHKFHFACLFVWVMKNPVCPMCRTPVA